MGKDIIIRVDGLWKRYGLPVPEFYYKGRKWLRSLRNRPSQGSESGDGPWALRDITFEIQRGETIGIIGRNGAGKSTLLKVLAEVTHPTIGKIDVSGRIFPMIELNAGVHPELTGRENLFLLGAIMGLKRREMASKISAVEEFCELGEWFDRPARMYSSGMLTRLGFSVAMNVDADILLVDEVLAVGDLAFQRKCYDRIEWQHSQNITTLFVSHSIRQIERLCDRAILLEQGKIVKIGNAADVANMYYEKSHENSLLECPDISCRHFEGTGDIVVTKVILFDESRNIADKIQSGKGIGLRLHFKTTSLIEQPTIGIGILTIDMIPVIVFSNDDITHKPDFNGTGIFECFLPDVPLLRGIYCIKVKIIHKNGAVLFVAEDMARFQVVSGEAGESNLAQAGLIRASVVWNDGPEYTD